MQQRIRHMLKPTLIGLSCIGGWMGGVVGLGFGNRDIYVNLQEHRDINPGRTTHYSLHHSIPLITGIMGAVFFPVITIISPLIVFEYMRSGCILDKAIDKVISSYKITCTRYHQYGFPEDGKYYAPSHLHFNIEPIIDKSILCNKQ
jgi:hypothetical protein